ncbi:hypothetical protein PIB30_099546 [Stylosanthes scabra]|uniref:Uncharacterized protein n=1 Tax=Stylosanthes scabra TaxID=79078 RepID=A0ABU6ZVH7_9FABA|nr:hypothetical protein [Stylosanthes scabra]
METPSHPTYLSSSWINYLNLSKRNVVFESGSLCKLGEMALLFHTYSLPMISDEEVFEDKIHAKKVHFREKGMKESMEEAKEGHGKQGEEKESQKEKRADATRPRPALPRPHP